jgi:hypothetical protein
MPVLKDAEEAAAAGRVLGVDDADGEDDDTVIPVLEADTKEDEALLAVELSHSGPLDSPN